MSNPNGPQPGATPEDYSDLSSNPNPFAGSSPAVDATRPSDWAPASYIGQYTNPPRDPNNPNANGAGTFDSAESALADSMASSLDALRDDVYYNRQPDKSANPGASGIKDDEGFGTSGTGQS